MDESGDGPERDGSKATDPRTGDDGTVDADGVDPVAADRSVDPETDRLLLDVMLGRLAVYLRMCGYDAAYALDEGVERDDRLLALARDEDRRLLTRDRALAARTPGGLLVRSREIDDQLGELLAADFDLGLAARPTRCGSCNSRVERVDEGDDGDGRPEHAPDDADLYRCRACGQHFWRGSHWDDVAARLARVKARHGAHDGKCESDETEAGGGVTEAGGVETEASGKETGRIGCEGGEESGRETGDDEGDERT